MKLLFGFAFLALICMARTAPTPAPPERTLIFQEYDNHDDTGIKQNVFDNDDDDDDDDDDEEINTTVVEDEDDEKAEAEEAASEVEEEAEEEDDDVEEETTTTTTSTTTRARSVFPSREQITLPSRRPFLNQRSSTTTTTTNAYDVDEIDESEQDYDGDFKYIKNIRKYIQKLMQDLKNLVKNLAGSDPFVPQNYYDETNHY